MRFRLPLVTAVALLVVSVALVAAEIPELVNTAPASRSLEHPNVGDKAPLREGPDKTLGLLNDEGGLLALGLAVVVAASMAVVVIRRRNRMPSY